MKKKQLTAKKIMSKKQFTPPVTRADAYEMVAPLDPDADTMFTDTEKHIAYNRLLQFIDIIFSE